MCITFFYINRDPNSKIKFLMVHNREEDFARPTSTIAQFEEDINIYGGRDLKEQGTWLGFNASTKNISFLTNRFSWGIYKDRIVTGIKSLVGVKSQAATISRGKLIQEFISSDFQNKYKIQEGENASQKYSEKVFELGNKFNPFNLLVGNLKDMEFVFQSNYDQIAPKNIEDGYHTFCNYSSFEKQTVKQKFGLNQFKNIVEEYLKEQNENSTIEAQNQKESILINNIHDTMENPQRHFELFFLPVKNESSLFIKPYYSSMAKHNRGTRTSTVVLLTDKNEITFSENTFYQNEDPKTNTKIQLKL